MRTLILVDIRYGKRCTREISFAFFRYYAARSQPPNRMLPTLQQRPLRPVREFLTTELVSEQHLPEYVVFTRDHVLRQE